MAGTKIRKIWNRKRKGNVSKRDTGEEGGHEGLAGK